MTAAPATPATRNVVRAPMAAASGAVRAKESGTRPIDTNQSRLETRPSRARGTRRCFTVSHTTVPADSKPLNSMLTTMACQAAWANA